MKELQEIIEIWKQLPTQQTARTSHGLEVSSKPVSSALATLVKVEGSAYRRPGARMLVTSDERQVGTISGGCLESDVVKRSQEVLQTGIPTLVKYDTTSEDDMIWGLGLGCQGVAYILIEPLDRDSDVLALIDKCISTRQTGAVATVFKSEDRNVNRGDRIVLCPDDSIIARVSNSELKDLVTQDLQSVLQQQKSATQVYVLSEGTVEVFLEVIQPPTSLTIFGAGFDVLPVVHFAKELGWYVTVIDPLARPQTKERFNRCDRLILGSSDEITSQIKLDSETVAVIMSHNYLYDLEFLQTLGTIPLKYLGILGPKKRTDRLLQDLKYEGNILQTEQLYSPVGLDIGADNPESIALSIIAEIQAVIQNRQGGFLKDRNAPIHYDENVETF